MSHVIIKDILPELDGMCKNLLEFMEVDQSFKGWLLTLDDREFDHVFERANRYGSKVVDVQFHFLVLLRHYKKAPEIGTGITSMEFTKMVDETLSDISRISLYKRGLFLLKKIGEGDEDWKFEITEKGHKVYNKKLREEENNAGNNQH